MNTASTTEGDVRVGLLWRAEWDPTIDEASVRQSSRLHTMFAAFETLGVTVELLLRVSSPRK